MNVTDQDSKPTLVPFEEAQKRSEIRKENELAEAIDPESETDILLDELRRGDPEPPRDYDQL